MRLRQAWQVVEADHQKAVAEGRDPVEVDALAARKEELRGEYFAAVKEILGLPGQKANG